MFSSLALCVGAHSAAVHYCDKVFMLKHDMCVQLLYTVVNMCFFAGFFLYPFCVYLFFALFFFGVAYVFFF